MSFWNTSDNQNAGDTGGEFESGGNMEPIPADTSVLAAPEEAGWDEYEGHSYISIRWTVLAPADYKNRKVFQKLHVNGDPSAKDSAKKADKSKRMLAAIDTNAGGQLLASGDAPTDESLSRCLVNKPMMLKLQVWEIDTENGKKSGNWVSAVAPKGNAKPAAAPKSAEKPAQNQQPESKAEDFDDDIGF